MLEWITNIISSLGYLGIAVLMLLENVFPPLPSEIIMPLAGFTVQQGKLSLPFAILAGTAGSVLGALPWYYVGRVVSEQRLRQWIDKHGKWLTLSGQDIDKSKRWFGKYSRAVVFFGRVIPGIRTFISVPAGLEEMPWLPFLLYSTVGTLLWVGLLTYAGYVLGQNYQLVKKFLGPISAVVIVAIIVAFGFWLRRRQRRAKRQNGC